jgi:1,4-dihydroxy-2-naphthoate octaprenyltransferase
MASNKSGSIQNWLQAFRLRTLPLSISGILLGSALAYRAGHFDVTLFVLALLTVLFLQILSNLANDLGDNLKGTDNDNRIGPKRSTQTGAISNGLMKRAIFVFALLSLVFGGILAYLGTRNMALEVQITFYILAVACILAAIGYTMGKSAYGYLGLGDLFVFLFFGLLSVCGIHVLMTKAFDWIVLLPAVSIGLLSTAVLNLNNMRDHENDALCGKNTLVVKIGFINALKYHFALLLFPIIATVNYAAITEFWWSLLALLSYAILGKHIIYVVKNPIPEKLDSELGKVAISTFLYAILFSLSCLVF